ncbi:helix-turn-helix transcriptional regulator [Sinomonas flava]|uniref:LuxR C-terminal-related transcriptional regulator n=1 Tax=Sinomonas flava TaxID=496857 RepID=A0ABN3BU33_9MICC
MKTERVVGRVRDVERTTALLRRPGTAAVLVMGESGYGKSILLDATARAFDGELEPLRIHGSPALAKVPFGVLAPFLGGLPAEEAGSRVEVLRAFWRQVEDLTRVRERGLLLVIDDAHELDDSSSEVVAEVVSARWAKAIVAAPSGAALPRPLRELWLDGGVERLDLVPLRLEEARDYLESTLLGRFLPSVVRVLWQESHGNPLVLGSLVDEARREGSLIQRGGTWILAGELPRRADGLLGLARAQIARLSAEERDCLSLIVVAEPAPLELVERECGPESVRQLVAKRLVRQPEGAHGVLRLRHPVYGDALVQLIPRTRAIQLHQSAAEYVREQTSTAEGLLRAVSWALDSGFETDDATLLRAASLSVRLFENALAERAAKAVQEPQARARAKEILGQIAFNRGEYAQAQAVLAPTVGRDGRVRPGLGGCLVWLMSRALLGHDLTAVRRDAEALGVEDPGTGRLLALAADFLRGDVDSVRAGLLTFLAEEPEYDDEAGVVLAVLEAQVAVAQGRPVHALATVRKAVERLAGDSAADPFVVGLGAASMVAAAQAAGDWAAAEDALTRYLTASNAGLICAGAAAECARGLSLVRRGRFREAWPLLAVAVDGLRERDPQRVLRLAEALAAYAGAGAGRQAEAEDLMREAAARDGQWAGFVGPLADLFLAAAAHSLVPDARRRRALAKLVASAEAGTRQDVALQAELLWFEAGGRDRLGRLGRLAGGVEGPWALAAAALADALVEGEAEDLLAAGEQLFAAGYERYARECFAEASKALDRGLRRSDARAVWARKTACDTLLGDEGGPIAATDPRSLTKREREIASFAVAGLSDREIADRLTVSVRTVEGHLYRAYAKLGVTSREQLASSLGRTRQKTEYTAGGAK